MAGQCSTTAHGTPLHRKHDTAAHGSSSHQHRPRPTTARLRTPLQPSSSRHYNAPHKPFIAIQGSSSHHVIELRHRTEHCSSSPQHTRGHLKDSPLLVVTFTVNSTRHATSRRHISSPHSTTVRCTTRRHFSPINARTFSPSVGSTLSGFNPGIIDRSSGDRGTGTVRP